MKQYLRFAQCATLVVLGTVAQSQSFFGTGLTSTAYYGGALINFENGSSQNLLLNGKFKLNVSDAYTGATYAVYTKNGALVGNESTATGWSLLGTWTGNTNDAGTWTEIDVQNTLSVAAGSTVGIGIFHAGGVDQTGGYIGYRGGGDSFTNGEVTITTGVAKGARGGTIADPDLFFSDSFAPRTWTGEVGYEAVPEPASILVLGCITAYLAKRKKKNG
jgi:hypothetical protein